MINLEQRYIEFIKKTVAKHLSNYTLYMFGSRVTGRAKKYSDIDIAIKSDNFTQEIKNKLQMEFDNSTLPYEVDIINLNEISDTFRNIIKDTLVEI